MTLCFMGHFAVLDIVMDGQTLPNILFPCYTVKKRGCGWVYASQAIFWYNNDLKDLKDLKDLFLHDATVHVFPFRAVLVLIMPLAL